MGWIAQEYEGNAHVVPDTETGHILAGDCFRDPTPEVQPNGVVWTHRDELARSVRDPDEDEHAPTD
jgi:hypothetical protein